MSLQDLKFCPGEPINVLYEPKPKGAIAYKWSDGSTKDTLRVFQTGEYSVTITIDDKYCYMLCDTSTLDYYDAPSALIGRGPQVCENTPYLLTVQAMGGKAGYTYAWNTQATTQTIQPSTTGTFSVTVTDACGQTARVNVTVGTDQWFGPPAVSVAKGPKVCKDTPFILSAAGAGGGGLYTFVWNTGETTASISNNKLGTYAVTVTDNCGKTGVASINVDNTQWLGLPSVQLARGPQVCKDSTFLLSAQGAGGLAPYTYAWNSGKTTAIIEGTVLGTYTVTITDACDTFATNSIIVDASIWNPGPAVEIELSEENSFCRTGSIGLEAFATAFGNGNTIVNYQWSAGNSNTNTTVVTAEGRYTITVTDACKQTAIAEFETGVLGVSCLKFPKIVFALDSAQMENKTFGAINQCGPDSSAVTDFVLKVFDRWGKEVFSADNIDMRWDGKLENATGNSNNNEDKYPPDVYVWFTRYKVGAFCQYEGKGDVTVFR
ncbi:MAG: gliding motility-associated C-terminal domain-containing protein [Saprospiraceae bacterium]|nr:gliding motility-associated C-terminal domain-containing protein [Saprospiraceae bacterium]